MKRNFDIIVDSGCDMSEEYLKKHEIKLVRLGFTMDNVNYEGEDGKRILEKDFYEKLRQGAMPITSQITGETAKAYIRESLENERDALVITFSSALSGTAGSFFVAARELSKKYKQRNIRAVDSLCASMGEGLLLYYAVQKAEEGASLEETADYIEELKGKICHHFTVDNLFHLKRGGRVTATTAIVGSILKIKPILHVDNGGRLETVGKAMGRKKALKTLAERFFERKDMDETDPVFISHGDCIEDAEYLASLIREKLPGVEIWINYVGAVIGAHSGAGTLALFHKGLYR